MLADNPDPAGEFTADSDDVAALVGADYSVQTVYVGVTPSYHAATVSAIQAGVGLVNYIGHAGVDRLAGEGMLTEADAVPGTLAPLPGAPILVAMTCEVGEFAVPGRDWLAEDLVNLPNGGASAVFAPTGLSLNSEAKQLDQAFFTARFSEGIERVGDVATRALETYAAGASADRSIMDNYHLLGDPALIMK
jgi:hypothetical protein